MSVNQTEKKEFQVLTSWMHTLETATKEMSVMAKALNAPILYEFNGQWLVANPKDHPNLLEEAYLREINLRCEEWENSEEYKEQEHQRIAEYQRKEAELKARLECAPSMEFFDEAAWLQSKSVNQNGYGGAVMSFSEQWARLMQAQIAQGKTMAECAEECERLPASVEGLTGFQYGCAVGILAQTWKHGEELRRWHNLKTQIHDEGERANESGGVLNPALLNIG